MDTLLCNDDGDIVIGTYDPSNTLLRLSADQYTAGSATWADQSGNALDFTVSTNTSLKGTDADGFPYMDFNGTYEVQHVDQIYPHQQLGSTRYSV